MEVQVAWLEPDPVPPEETGAATKTSKRPPFRPTMEVQLAWLEPEETASRSERSAEPEPTTRSSRKKPPRLPGAARTLPPMPLIPSQRPPPPRRTMEVEMSWLEEFDETKPVEASGAVEAPKRSSRRPATNAELIAPRRKRGKPIPREE